MVPSRAHLPLSPECGVEFIEELIEPMYGNLTCRKGRPERPASFRNGRESTLLAAKTRFLLLGPSAPDGQKVCSQSPLSGAAWDSHMVGEVWACRLSFSQYFTGDLEQK